MTHTTAPLSYATPLDAASRPTRVAPAVWLGILGLGLVVLGGCFLIGTMAILMPQLLLPGLTATVTPGLIVLLTVLYIAAFISFGGAALLLIAAARRLLKL